MEHGSHPAVRGPYRRPPAAGCRPEVGAPSRPRRRAGWRPAQLLRECRRGAPSQHACRAAVRGPCRRPPAAGCADRRSALQAVVAAGGRPSCCEMQARYAKPACVPRRCSGSLPPPAFGGLCRPEAGAPSRPRRRAGRRLAQLPPSQGEGRAVLIRMAHPPRYATTWCAGRVRRLSMTPPALSTRSANSGSVINSRYPTFNSSANAR